MFFRLVVLISWHRRSRPDYWISLIIGFYVLVLFHAGCSYCHLRQTIKLVNLFTYVIHFNISLFHHIHHKATPSNNNNDNDQIYRQTFT